MSPSQDFPAPDLFTAGTVGPLGQRVFYLQARQADVLLTLKAEKEQVSALAEYLAELLEKLGAPTSGVGPSPELAEPIVPAWAVRSLAVGYDGEQKRIVIVAEELREPPEGEGDAEETEETEEPEEGEEEAADAESRDPDAASARFALDRTQAAAFVQRARALVQAGRPSCPICGRPMNPTGHVCPRRNGAARD
jgi:uncharacterized repeat protein (TIGR03847 family)